MTIYQLIEVVSRQHVKAPAGEDSRKGLAEVFVQIERGPGHLLLPVRTSFPLFGQPLLVRPVMMLDERVHFFGMILRVGQRVKDLRQCQVRILGGGLSGNANRFEALRQLKAVSQQSDFRRAGIKMDGILLVATKLEQIVDRGTRDWPALEGEFPLIRQDGDYQERVLDFTQP
jgi:hypothetical protein